MPRSPRLGPSSSTPPVDQTSAVRRLEPARPAAPQPPQTLVVRLDLPPLDEVTPEPVALTATARAVDPSVLKRLQRG